MLTRIAAEHDLSVTQLGMLGILRDRTPTMAQIADYLELDRSSVSGLVDRAERRGRHRRARDAAGGRSRGRLRCCGAPGVTLPVTAAVARR
jgi:DNA-binding MarR family transcriptional regulator